MAVRWFALVLDTGVDRVELDDSARVGVGESGVTRNPKDAFVSL